MKKLDETNLDVLQSIEFGIIQVYRADKSLLDFDVKDAMDALVRHYRPEEEQRRPPLMRLGDRAQRVLSSVQAFCEWRLGRAAFPGDGSPPESATPIAELVECLGKVQKSVPLWSQRGGRQGYLSQFRQPVFAISRLMPLASTRVRARAEARPDECERCTHKCLRHRRATSLTRKSRSYLHLGNAPCTNFTRSAWYLAAEG
jgi:hypothetical protein